MKKIIWMCNTCKEITEDRPQTCGKCGGRRFTSIKVKQEEVKDGSKSNS